MGYKKLPMLVALSFISFGANAQYTLYAPNADEMKTRYKSAYLMDSITQNKVLNATLNVQWNPQDPTYCWYAKQTTPDKWDYMIVDLPSGNKTLAFNMDDLLKVFKTKYSSVQPKDFSRVFINSKKDSVRFAVRDSQYLYHPAGKTVDFIGKVNRREEDGRRFFRPNGFEPRWSRWRSFGTDSVSSDKKWTAFVRNGNLWLRNNTTQSETQYTTQGNDSNYFGSIAWSPDSKYLICYHVRPVVDTNVYYVLSSVPGTKRGVLKSHPYKQPGDPFTTYEMYIVHPGNPTKSIKVNTDIIDFFDVPKINWETDNQFFTYERVDRGHQRFRIVRVHALTGDTTNLLDEKSKTFIYESRLMTYYLPQTQQIIYSSEKDGWQHLYLLNTQTKKETLITKGDWIVRDVDSIDTRKKEIWFKASGLHAGEDPYNVHYCKIKFDGSGLVDLTPEKGNHIVSFSSDKKYMVDRYSQVNVAPVTKLRNMENRKESILEAADTKGLEQTGVSLPEPFVAKGRDGVTDIYGVVCKPSNMEPNKKYPLIENIYAGPQDAFVPKDFLPYSEMQSIAELGFIVVQIDGMGTANRSKAFHDVCWKNLQDAGFPDRILWMKALTHQYPFVDHSRVGLYGTSAGGQDALCGLLTHPEFYKAGVAACGCHDNRIDKQWWNEQWMGYPVGEHYAAQSNVTNAYRLKGSLMLIVGDADENVPPESTYRVADALIHAGKSFDFLPVPGANHTDGGPYGRERKKDFFVQHLLNVTPPERNVSNEFPLPTTGVR
ncbi:MAG: prolyl oligopeptidase family serine peptidase [Chitinophagaceae bacterium]